MRDDITYVNTPPKYMQDGSVRGEWLHISDGYCDFFKCSQCGKSTDSRSNFCPNCGADMRQKTANPMESIKVPKMPITDKEQRIFFCGNGT